MHQIVIHRGVPGFVAIFVSAIAVEVNLLVGVLDLGGANDTDGNVLFPLAVGQVVHGLRFAATRLGLVLPLLHFEPEADHKGGTAQQQHQDQNNSGTHCNPWKLSTLTFSILLRDVHNDWPLGWFREQKLAVEPPISSSALTHITVVSLVASSPIVTRAVFTFADRGATVLSTVSRGTGARIVINSILAGPTIETRKGSTVIHIIITVSSREASWTLAYVGIPKINTLGTCQTVNRINDK